MRRQGRSGQRGTRWAGIALLCGLAAGPSCGTFPGPAAAPEVPNAAGPIVQEGEVTVADGGDRAVRYKKAFASPPRLTIVEFRQSYFKEKPYSKDSFVFVDQEGTGFRVLNLHAEPGGQATIKWRAEGALSAVQPAAPPVGLAARARGGQLTQDQLVAAIKDMKGAVGFDPPPLPNAPRPITSLDFHHTPVTDADLEQLRGLTRLRTLNLSGTAVTDAGMRWVGEMTALQVLQLNETRVGDAGVQQVQRLTELRELSLFHTRVTDDGLAALQGLVNLRELTLNGRQITDRGLARLGGLRDLKHLYLSNTGVTATGVQELKKALPKTQIIQ
jgi:hypothetical protein